MSQKEKKAGDESEGKKAGDESETKSQQIADSLFWLDNR